MKKRLLIGLFILPWLLFAILIYLHQDRVRLVKLPPQSLAQWYQPENERHVWLHTMFNLRRDMQAIEQIFDQAGAEQALQVATEEQREKLAEWVNRFADDYQKIAEMVPEWKHRLDQKAVQNLKTAQASDQYDEVAVVLESLQVSCNDCHRQFRSVTAALYRTPNFDHIRINANEPLSDSMKSLNTTVNQIKLAIRVGEQELSLAALGELRHGIDAIGEVCSNCHEKMPKTYPEAGLESALNELQASLESDDMRQQGRDLGTVAVMACAQCHGTHRIAYDIKQMLTTKPSLLEVLRH